MFSDAKMYRAQSVNLLLVNGRDMGLGESAVTHVVDGGLTGALEAVLGVNTLNTVGGVDVLDEGQLPAGSASLAGGDGRVGQEVLPDLRNRKPSSQSCSTCIMNCGDNLAVERTYSKPSLAVLGLDLLAVTHPVAVPAPKSSRVVDTNGINTLDFKTSALQLIDDESKRSAGVSSGEDVLVHEQTPDEILILPRLTDTSDLEEEYTIIIKHVIDLGQEGTEVANTDVLCHLKTSDLVVTALDAGSITVVQAENAALRFGDAGVAETLVTPGSLVTTESDTGDLRAIVDRSIFGESTPATTQVEKSVTGLNIDLLTDNS
jgi:hypothetical protein